MYKLIAHRGYKANNKENTIDAYISAINNNFAGFECDIRESKDGKIIVFHDPLFKGQLIRKLNYVDLQKEEIILFERVLEIKTDKIILVDIKDPFININVLIEILNKYPNKNLYITSFYNNVIYKLNTTYKKYKIGVLNYILNTEKKHFEYDFLCILNSTLNDTIISNYARMNKELFVYGIIKKNYYSKYPYYIVD